MTAGWMKIFSPSPLLGFLSAAHGYRDLLAEGTGTAIQVDHWPQLMVNNYIDAGVTGLFLGLVILVVLACAQSWVQLLSGRRAVDLREEPYVRTPAAVAVASSL